jgi:hypothetical protein
MARRYLRHSDHIQGLPSIRRVGQSRTLDVVVDFPAAAKPVFEFMELSGMPMYETVDEICCEEVVLKWANNYLVVM